MLKKFESYYWTLWIFCMYFYQCNEVIYIRRKFSTFVSRVRNNLFWNFTPNYRHCQNLLFLSWGIYTYMYYNISKDWNTSVSTRTVYFCQCVPFFEPLMYGCIVNKYIKGLFCKYIVLDLDVCLTMLFSPSFKGLLNKGVYR